MKTIIINKEQLFDILENDVVKKVSAKWGVAVTEHVVYEGKDYIVTYNRHDGILGERFVLFPAYQKTKVITEWAPIE